MLAYHKGDVYKYTFELTAHETIDLVVETIQETSRLTYTVRSVDAGGNADLSLDLSDAVRTATVDQVAVPVYNLPSATIDLKVAADGRILSQRVNGNPFGGTPIWAVLAGRGVKPGDRWSKEYDTNTVGYSGNNHIKSESQYLRNESFAGVNAAVVETTMAMTIDVSNDPSVLPIPNGAGENQKVTVIETAASTVTTWVDRSAHRILKSRMTATFDLTMTSTGTTGPTSITGDETSDLLPG